MLTTELLRVRHRKGQVIPRYVDTSSEMLLELADSLVALFQAHEGRSLGDLREAIRDIEEGESDLLLVRGLVKLLEDGCDFETRAVLDPREVRRRLFEASAAVHPVASTPPSAPRGTRLTRDEVLQEVASAMDVGVSDLEAALYADLPEARILTNQRPPSAIGLLQRYNVALAQAVLLRAFRVVITIAGNSPGRYRQLFRFLKFFRLMHLLTSRDDGSFVLEVDGPLSLFKQHTRYGIQLAELLPAVLLCDRWQLEADLRWGPAGEAREFRLTEREGLVSHYQDRGAWMPREVSLFAERLNQLETPWTMDTAPLLLRLGGQAVIMPDFALRHGDGRIAYVEILGFWRRNYLERRLELYRTQGPGNLILALSRQLQGSVEGLEGFEGAVVVFREIISVPEVLKEAERVARRREEGDQALDASASEVNRTR